MIRLLVANGLCRVHLSQINSTLIKRQLDDDRVSLFAAEINRDVAAGFCEGGLDIGYRNTPLQCRRECPAGHFADLLLPVQDDRMLSRDAPTYQLEPGESLPQAGPHELPQCWGANEVLVQIDAPTQSCAERINSFVQFVAIEW